MLLVLWPGFTEPLRRQRNPQNTLADVLTLEMLHDPVDSIDLVGRDSMPLD